MLSLSDYTDIRSASSAYAAVTRSIRMIEGADFIKTERNKLFFFFISTTSSLLILNECVPPYRRLDASFKKIGVCCMRNSVLFYSKEACFLNLVSCADNVVIFTHDRW